MKNGNHKQSSLFIALLCTPIIAATPALAADKDNVAPDPPAIFTELISCKAIVEPEQRLACFDAKVAALETAQSSNQLVIADREQVREARRGLFGLSLPRIKLFDGDKEDGDNVDKIDATISSVRKLRGGKWLIVLDDGAKWQQTEARSMMRSPRAADSIEIKRGSLGSFVAKVNDGRAFKVKRIVN
ncbi:hypothetical protein [Parasphingorhabdus cellanae]|uniref:Uncharacterized protein n=1 Tax=Parasphingorhabdus cellanae TaxID=2806553 RepID=A0ABX7T7U8_9SPHN|nr:hypothetical protein [Parasphingorhabdus cellanae]QTD56973.1 hypothetical protein J4G78_05235 [Parasphingorhabdus cellanae]